MDETEATNLVLDYVNEIPSKALAGDVFAVSAILIAAYFTLFLINKLTELFILFLKKIILLVIVSLAFYHFIILLIERYNVEGASTDVMLFGGLGFLVGCIALIIAFHAAFSSLRTVGKKEVVSDSLENETQETTEDSKKKAKGKVSRELDRKKILSMEAIKKDRGLGIVIAYLIVAEFGVISSKTVAAPSITSGLIFFFAFVIAAIFFIHQTYNNPNTGMRHFIAVFLVGGILSIVLGVFWGGYEIGTLLSEAYFVSDSLVAFVTGIAVSLFMGSKG